MLEAILGVLTGGATGLIGTVVTKMFAAKEADTKHKQQMELLDKQLAVGKQEGEMALQVEAVKTDGEGFASSIRADRAAYYHGNHWALAWVDVVRGVTRPALTWLLVTLTAVLWFTTDDKQLQDQVVVTILYLTSVAVTWWFGTRPPGKSK